MLYFVLQKPPSGEPPCSPDLFGDSFNDHDSFFEKIDIEIEKRASQDKDKVHNENNDHCKGDDSSDKSADDDPCPKACRTRKRKNLMTGDIDDVKCKSTKDTSYSFFLASDDEEAFMSNSNFEKLSQKADNILSDLNKLQESHRSQAQDTSNNESDDNHVKKVFNLPSEHQERDGQTLHTHTKHKTSESDGHLKISSLTTPGSASSSRLSRLKKTLQKNATTPQNPQRIQQYREEQVVNALKDAEIIQAEGGKFDIGPFYGLPSHVQKLFQEQRGISKLYGEINLLFHLLIYCIKV